jgi:hypothetical protein
MATSVRVNNQKVRISLVLRIVRKGKIRRGRKRTLVSNHTLASNLHRNRRKPSSNPTRDLRNDKVERRTVEVPRTHHEVDSEDVNEDASDADPFVAIRELGEGASDDGGDAGGEHVGGAVRRAKGQFQLGEKRVRRNEPDKRRIGRSVTTSDSARRRGRQYSFLWEGKEENALKETRKEALIAVLTAEMKEPNRTPAQDRPVLEQPRRKEGDVGHSGLVPAEEKED